MFYLYIMNIMAFDQNNRRKLDALNVLLSNENNLKVRFTDQAEWPSTYSQRFESHEE